MCLIRGVTKKMGVACPKISAHHHLEPPLLNSCIPIPTVETSTVSGMADVIPTPAVQTSTVLGMADVIPTSAVETSTVSGMADVVPTPAMETSTVSGIADVIPTPTMQIIIVSVLVVVIVGVVAFIFVVIRGLTWRRCKKFEPHQVRMIDAWSLVYLHILK